MGLIWITPTGAEETPANLNACIAGSGGQFRIPIFMTANRMDPVGYADDYPWDVALPQTVTNMSWWSSQLTNIVFTAGDNVQVRMPASYQGMNGVANLYRITYAVSYNPTNAWVLHDIWYRAFGYGNYGAGYTNQQYCALQPVHSRFYSSGMKNVGGVVGTVNKGFGTIWPLAIPAGSNPYYDGVPSTGVSTNPSINTFSTNYNYSVFSTQLSRYIVSFCWATDPNLSYRFINLQTGYIPNI